MAERYKIVVYVPVANAEELREAMGKAGAGKIGNYSQASFSVRGIGRFRPEAGAKPYVGVVGKIEEVAEERIELVCEEASLPKTLAAIREVHPYEEPAIDIYPLADFSFSPPGYEE